MAGGNQEQRYRELVEGDDEGEDGSRHDAGLGQGQRHLEIGTQGARAEVARSLFQARIEILQNSQRGAHYIGDRHQRMTEHQPPQRPADIQQDIGLEQSQAGQDRRQHQRGQHDRRDDARTGETSACQGERGTGAEQRRGDSRHHRDLEA